MLSYILKIFLPKNIDDILKTFSPKNKEDKHRGGMWIFVLTFVGFFFGLKLVWYQSLAWAAIATSVLIIWYFAYAYVPYWYFKYVKKPPKNLLVVIANFEPIPSDDIDAKSHAETVSVDLEIKIRGLKVNSGVPMEYPIRHKQIIESSTEEEKKQKAREIGFSKGSHLVLWGSIQFTKLGDKGEFYLEPRITIVQSLGPTELEERQPDVLRVSLSEPNIMELRQRKIEETADIVSFIHGLAIYKQLKFEDAINIFKGIEVPDADVCFYHGMALVFLSRFEEAIEQFDKALEISPRDAEAYNNRGIAYYSKGEYDRAISDYSKVIEINPRDAVAYYNRGIAYAQGKGEYDLAIGDFSKAIEINPRFAPAYVNRGAIYAGKGECELATDDFNKALEINPRLADAYNNRAVAYNYKGAYDRASSDCDKAIEINPRLAGAYNNRAVAYYFKRDFDKAWEDVHKAQGLGYQVHPEFLDALRQASGRQR